MSNLMPKKLQLLAQVSRAWLLSGQHQVCLYEKDDRLDGHSNTIEVIGHQP
ncbi:hypothetical protein [uncultured Pseudoteredinibacter sp.]|uniref:hypothetical protein n=1 Tax=uncultured Pseudoteredinibacter sp. TaxID=1641701 RepID=UPI002632B041|nr:hypothetical protein [uncultured Pseudoteredinibacter sp.]